MVGDCAEKAINDIAKVTDYVANGSFASLKENVTYNSNPDYAVLVRLVDFSAGWSGNFVYVSESSYNFLRKSALEPGDVIISNVGANAGTVFRAPALLQPMTLGPNAVVLKPRDNTPETKAYLYYLLSSQMGQAKLHSILSGSAQPKFNKTDLRELSIPYAEKETRAAIAHILGALDDKIELNRKMNQTLEAMARAIFKSWFVDFYPVRAKVECRDTGLPHDLSALFPDSFEESLGEIPKGWRIQPLGDVLELAYGKALKEEDRHPGQIPVFGSNGQVGWHDEKLATGPGIIVGRKGNPGIVTWAPTDFFSIDTTFYVVPKGECKSLYFLFYTLRAQGLASLGSDSAVPGLNRNLTYMNRLVVPTTPLLDAFDKKVSPIFKRVNHNNEESYTLAALRDSLLPKLLSGEIRAKEYKEV